MRHRNLPPMTWRSLTAATIAASLLLGLLVSESAQAQVYGPAAPTALARYTRDITAAAEQGKFDSFGDQAKETSRALAILAERNNPVLLTDSQAERNVVIAGVARQIVRGQGPEELIGRRVLKLDLDKLFHDTKNAEELKTTLTAVLSLVAITPDAWQKNSNFSGSRNFGGSTSVGPFCLAITSSNGECEELD